MSNEILDALGQIAREKGVDRQMLIETLEAGMASAVRKKHGETADVQVRLDSGTGQLALALRYAVVADVEDPSCQMTVDRARAFQADVAVGDYIMTPLNVAEFGRNAIQTAKQVLVQRVREAERDKVFKAYADKVGTLVRGVVQQVDRGNVIVKLDFSEGVLPAREQIPRSYHRPNEYVRAVVISVDRAAKGPQVTLSRTHPDFLRRLFENEVPEITDGIVEVKAVAREAGARSKISVHSTDPRVDAVGSCVGLKGSRVQGIVRELGGERIDIVPWSADPAVFVSRALAPARGPDGRVNEHAKRMTVVVADDQLSLAIGKGGQNARLAARLTGWHIDLVSKTDEKQRHDVERASRLEVEQLGLGEATTEKLIQGGIETVQELVSTPFEKLVELPGIGEKTAEKVMTIALEFMAAYEAAMESATADMGFAPGMEPGEGASPDAAEGGPNG
jgi:N utilization substance protein A